MSAATVPVAGGEVVTRRAPGRGVPLRGLLPLVVLLAAWQLAGDAHSTSFPTPSTWIDAIKAMNDQDVLVPALLSTLRTFAVSLVVATLLGVALGVAVGSSARVARALSPSMEFLRAIPPPTLVPVVVLLISGALWAGVVVVVLAIVWPILMNTVTGMRTIPPVRLEMARTVGLSRAERFAKIVLPSLTPAILLGVRIAVSIALVVTLVADILGSGDGAGRLLVERQQTFDAPSVWGLLLIIGVFGFLLNAALGFGEARLLRNRPDGGAA